MTNCIMVRIKFLTRSPSLIRNPARSLSEHFLLQLSVNECLLIVFRHNIQCHTDIHINSDRS